MRLLLLISGILLGSMSSQASSPTYLSSAIHASDNDMLKLTIDNQMIQDISYSYEVVQDNHKLNCIGTLNVSLNLAPDVSYMVFERTSRFAKFDNPEDVRFSLKSVWPNTTTNIIIPDFYWDTYFRIWFRLEDDTDIYSPTYSINDFIDTSDLELLQSQGSASIENIDADDENVRLSIVDKNLEISSTEPIYLNVLDLYGRSIFNRDMVTAEIIPLNNVSSPFIIVRYKTSRNIITKKILL